MNSKIAALVIAIIVVVGGVYYVGTRNHGSNTSNSSSQTSSGISGSQDKSQSPSSAATVTYTDNGFSPAETTIKSGQTITFVNNSSSDIQVDSNPHPVHTDDTDLNVGMIAAGQSKTVTLTKVGTFGFHNHINPSNTARVTIQ